jgi:hypothetical protein
MYKKYPDEYKVVQEKAAKEAMESVNPFNRK